MRRDGSAAHKWLASIGRNPGAGTRLFCLPHAGGGGSTYYSWTAALPPSIEVCPIQLPGRETRIGESCFREMPALVDALREVIDSTADRPFALFGHSMGALVAFELARECRAAPLRLFVAGHPAPHLPRDSAPLHPLPDGEFLAEVERRYDAIPPEVKTDVELLSLVLPVLRADFCLVETYPYRAGGALRCPISVFGGADDPYTPRAALEAWRLHSAPGFTMRILPGQHFFVQTAREQILRSVAEDLHLSCDLRGPRP
jgi:surfactin synthase thioesterase subunit